MKFKIGDKVKHKDFGVGEIIGFDVRDNKYAVEFENENVMMHNFLQTYMDAGLSHPIDREAGFWCFDDEIELVEETPKNLIPQIAKMLGVEIGERFSLKEYPENYYILDAEIGLCDNRSDGKYDRNFVLGEIVVGKYTVRKLPKKPILTEDEKAILRNLPKQYKYIARDYYGALYIYENKPKKDGKSWWIYGLNNFNLFQYLFQFIKWEDEEPYNIKELLEEYENLRSE